MKLEEILPEIRKGRRYRRQGWPWHGGSSRDSITKDNLLADDWELEPEPKVIDLGGGIKATNISPSLWMVETQTDHKSIVFSYPMIDALKAAADEAGGRGKRKPEDAEPDWDKLRCLYNDTTAHENADIKAIYYAGYEAGRAQSS